MNSAANSFRCAILGSPVAHSLSPVLFTAAFAALGMNWKYSRQELIASQLPDFLAECDDSWQGFSVTMPGKIAALQVADVVSEQAKIVGAANTLYRLADSRWGADNTDISGIKAALVQSGYQENFFREGVTIIGSGGTARAAIAAAYEFQLPITIVARNIPKAQELETIAQELNIKLHFIDFTYDQLAASCSKTAVTISTVPLLALSADFFPAVCCAQSLIDILYSPWPTPLISYAKTSDKAITTVGGLTVLLYQAFAQFEKITSTIAPREVMAAALAAATGVHIPCDLV